MEVTFGSDIPNEKRVIGCEIEQRNNGSGRKRFGEINEILLPYSVHKSNENTEPKEIIHCIVVKKIGNGRSKTP